MNKVIIFDFNRTIYDPEQHSLIAGALAMLKELIGQGFQLHLISMAAPSREELIRNLGLHSFFESVTLCEHKSLKIFEKILQETEADIHQSFAVGDRVKKELYFANQLGLTTVWYKQGRFAAELPQTMAEHPTYITHSLSEIPRIVARHLTP